MSAPLDEEARLTALHGYGVLDTRHVVLDELAALASSIFDMPVCAVSLIDRDRVWFAGSTGWSVSEVPRSTSFCTYMIGGQTVVVPDSLVHPTFHVYGRGPRPIRFFAGAPIVDPDGHVLGAFCLVDSQPRDFDERQVSVLQGLAGQAARHLAALRNTRELAEAVAHERDFVSTVTHELRTPVTVIKGYLEALADEPDLKRYRPMVDTMRRSGDRLIRMVDHLLAGSAQEEPAVTTRPGHVDLVCVARAAVAVGLRTAQQRDVRIRLEVPAGELPTSGDFGRLCQVADQMLSNAVAFSEPGSEVVVRVADADGPFLEVVDHGAGIPAEELTHLTERFYRGLYAREHAVPGVGLGLSIAEEIVAAHGGSLSVTSAGPGAGTTALLRMPALRSGTGSGHCSTRRPHRRSGPGGTRRPGFRR